MAKNVTGQIARKNFRDESSSGPTSGIADRYLQANLAVLPSQFADEFELYCFFNKQPCPIVEKLPAGDPLVILIADNADIRTDLPRYLIHTSDPGGISIKTEEVLNLKTVWSKDWTAFLLGCSFSFERALIDAGVWRQTPGSNVPMYITSRQTTPHGIFSGPLVVSMRAINVRHLKRVYEICASLPLAHGRPVYHGDPQMLGIQDLSNPDFGCTVEVQDDEIPVFWACGVTSILALKAALKSSAIDTVVTHKPGHMFISDITSDKLIDVNCSNGLRVIRGIPTYL
eukprot:133856_1